jgi:hypothetical protein
MLPVTVLLALALGAQAVPQRTTQQLAPSSQRKIPCKVPENASMCYWTRGRLQVSMGAGSWKMWKVGTKRIVTVFNGPSGFPARMQDEVRNAEFPANLEKAYQAEIPRLERLKQAVPDLVYADFEICPLEPEREGASQAVCIESAKNIFFDGSKRIYQ